jgi:PAS domain S-box-containing protein
MVTQALPPCVNRSPPLLMAILQIRTPTKKVDHKIDRQLRILFDTASELKVCMLDRGGRIIGWNKSAERLTGYMAKEVIGKNYSCFTSKEEVQRRVFKKALAIASKRGHFTAEGIRVRKDGSHFWGRTLITPMNNRDGSFKFFVLITMNISREREVAQKREEYIGIASHELKNPVATLSLYSELLAKRLELDRNKENLRMLRDIQGQTARLTALINDLLVVGTMGQGTMELHKEIFDPRTFAKHIVRDFQNTTLTHKITCTTTGTHDVRADKERISQVFINLLTNAVKYSPGEKRVIVRVAEIRGKCLISIQDFGPGIKKADQSKIFTRFFRSAGAEAGNVSGSGLGLYISKEIIKMHRERLTMKSVVGRGTTFAFTLPLS